MALVDNIVRQHLLPLFEGYELVPDVDGHSSPPDRLLTGRVELQAEDVRGSVGVCGSSRSLEGTAPFGGIDPADWVAELANLAAGRLKYGVLSLTRLRLAQSTPSVVGGDAAPAAGPSTRVLKLRGRAGSLRVWLELEGVDALPESPNTTAMAPGQSLFFD